MLERSKAIAVRISEDVRERFDALGVSPSGVSPEEFGKFVHEDYERIGKYVKQADIRLD